MPHLILLGTQPSIHTNTYSLLCKKTDEVTIERSEKIVSNDLNEGLVSYEFEIEMISDKSQCVKYAVNGRTLAFTIPAIKDKLNVLYTSCNKNYQDNVWDKIKEQHTTKPYHLTIGGGDQIYMDDVWKLPSLSDWKAMTIKDKLSMSVSTLMISEITEFYKERYNKKWFSSPEYTDVLPLIPSINMWDDHDIFDGYGSFPTDVQNSNIVKAVYLIARNAFMIYQLHMKPTALNINLTSLFEMNNALFVNVDTRTNRTRLQILKPATYTKIFTAIDASKAKNVMILLSTAVAFRDQHHSSTEQDLNLFSLPGREDDEIDGWCNKLHANETNQFMDKLFEVKKLKKNVTILVGDVHIGGDGRVEQKSMNIPQYISSGVGSITNTKLPGGIKLPDGTISCVDSILNSINKVVKSDTLRTSGGIKYIFDETSIILNYNWARVVIDVDTKYTHYSV